MEHITIKLPERVLGCIQSHYPGYNMISSREEQDNEGHVFYIVDLLCDGSYCHARINEVGKLMEEQMEPQFSNGYHEQYY